MTTSCDCAGDYSGGVLLCSLHAAAPDMLAALTKIATAPEGAYSRDREQYLKNVIEWCQETAQAAIDKASPQA